MGKGDSDPLVLAHAAYRPASDWDEWMHGVVEAAAPSLDEGFGSFGWVMRAPSFRPVHIVGRGPAAELVPVFAEVVDRLEREYGVEAFRALALGARSFTSSTERSREGLGMELHAQPGFEFALDAGVIDFVFVQGTCPSGLGVCVGAPLRRYAEIRPSHRHRWARVAAHLASGLRLRDRDRRPSPDEAAAVLSPKGAMLHAADAWTASHRERLREACLAAERTHQPNVDVDRALDGWTALTSGRYSLVDHFDSDGRRFVLAVRNEPHLAAPAGLTPRETQVAAYVALGHPLKTIAYELGLSVATVGRDSASAVRKLGLSSRVELATLLRSMLGRSPQE